MEDTILTVSESTVLREVFGREGVNVTGGWRRLYSEGPHGSYCSPVVARMIS